MSRPATSPAIEAPGARPAMLAFWRSDLTCAFANEPYGEWFGRTAETMVGVRKQDLLGPELFGSHRAYIAGALEGEEQRFERTVVRADGRVGHLLTTYVPQRDAAGAVVGFAALLTDVTALDEAEDALRMAASVFGSTVDGIAVSGIDGIIRSVNPAFTDLTGYTAAEAIGQPRSFPASEPRAEQLAQALTRAIAEKGFWRGEVWSRRKNGERFLGQQTTTLVRGPDGDPIHYVTVLSDVTEAWRRNEGLRHRALHDELTGLPNRALLMERLERMIDPGAGSEAAFALVFIDLDGFKSVNDRHGHVLGDRLLTTVARRLRNAVRSSDLVSRLGGDEFVVLLDGVALASEAEAAAVRIAACLGEPIELGPLIRISASAGIARYPADGRDAAALLASADAAMYAAKDPRDRNVAERVVSRLVAPSTTCS